MKHYQFPARAFLGWIRICRPGSILGPQQQFLLDMQAHMFQAGAAMRRLPASPSLQMVSRGDAERATLQAKFSSGERPHAEQCEDVGQGERLRNAKRFVSARRGNAARTSAPGDVGATRTAGIPLEMVLPPVSRQGGGAGLVLEQLPACIGKQQRLLLTDGQRQQNRGKAWLALPHFLGARQDPPRSQRRTSSLAADHRVRSAPLPVDNYANRHNARYQGLAD
jgi:hypothetical protein